MDDFRDQVKKGFIACKNDIETLKVNEENFILKINQLQSENSNLKQQLIETNNSVEELKIQLKTINLALSQISEFNNNLNNNYNNQQINQHQINNNIDNNIYNSYNKKINNEIQTPIKKKVKDPYEALLEFKAKSNKRELLKQKMQSMISVNGINLSELKFMFVEHFKYCSKATFYNYLKELELEKKIEVKRENSKNFVHLNKMPIEY